MDVVIFVKDVNFRYTAKSPIAQEERLIGIKAPHATRDRIEVAHV